MTDALRPDGLPVPRTDFEAEVVELLGPHLETATDPELVYALAAEVLESATGRPFATLLDEELLAPLGLEYLRTITFILVIAVVVQFTEMVMHKTSPLLYQVLGIFLPLITTNCAVLGVALLNIQEQHSFVESALYGFGAAIGFSLVLVLFAAVRERVAVADVPEPFQGNAIALVTAGLMSMAFMGFAGLVKG